MKKGGGWGYYRGRGGRGTCKVRRPGGTHSHVTKETRQIPTPMLLSTVLFHLHLTEIRRKFNVTATTASAASLQATAVFETQSPAFTFCTKVKIYVDKKCKKKLQVIQRPTYEFSESRFSSSTFPAFLTPFQLSHRAIFGVGDGNISVTQQISYNASDIKHWSVEVPESFLWS
jgi:hypothetical protein